MKNVITEECKLHKKHMKRLQAILDITLAIQQKIHEEQESQKLHLFCNITDCLNYIVNASDCLGKNDYHKTIEKIDSIR